MTPENLIWIAMLLPVVAIALVFFVGEKSPNIRESCTIGIAVTLFWVTTRLAGFVFSGGRPSFKMGEILPGFEIAFTVEPLGMLFALVASGLWILTTVLCNWLYAGASRKKPNSVLCLLRIGNFCCTGCRIRCQFIHAVCSL